MKKSVFATSVALLESLFVPLFPPVEAGAAPVPAEGYVYASQVLDENTEGCLAPGPNGVFVGNGPIFVSFPPPAGTREIRLVTPSGDVTTVATGLNSISDCVYDQATDTLYVTDSGFEFAGATTGDTVFAIPGSSVSVDVDGLEVLPAGTIPFAFAIALDGDRLLVSDAAGGGLGSVLDIDLTSMPPTASTFATDFDYTGALLVDGSSVLVAESLPGFDSALHRYTSAGVFQSTISGPTYDHGSVDLAKAADGSLVLSGSPTLVALDEGVATPLVTGLNGGTMFDAYGGGVAVDPFTGRIDFLASTFSGAPDDSSIHHLVPIDRLVPGGGATATDCAMEFYGVELVPASPGRPAKQAICVDGAACDADGEENDECAFPLGLCFNVDDDRLAECSASGIAALELASAKPASVEAAGLVEAAAGLLPLADSTCAFGDSVKVPLRLTSSGERRRSKATIRVRATLDGDPVRRDTDVLRLVCEPAP